MNKKDLKDIKAKDDIVCAPKEYRLADVAGEDYEVNAKILSITDRNTIAKIKDSIVAECDYVYGPSTGYKGHYSYNRDN